MKFKMSKLMKSDRSQNNLGGRNGCSDWKLTWQDSRINEWGKAGSWYCWSPLIKHIWIYLSLHELFSFRLVSNEFCHLHQSLDLWLKATFLLEIEIWKNISLHLQRKERVNYSSLIQSSFLNPAVWKLYASLGLSFLIFKSRRLDGVGSSLLSGLGLVWLQWIFPSLISPDLLHHIFLPFPWITNSGKTIVFFFFSLFQVLENSPIFSY